MAACRNTITSEEAEQVLQFGIKVINWSDYITCFVWLCCLIAVIAGYRRGPRPGFVWVVWILLLISGLLFTAYIILIAITNKAGAAGEDAKFNRLERYVNEIFSDYLAIQSTAHWVLATQYLEVVLKIPILLDPATAKSQQRRKIRIDRLLIVLNILFYTANLADFTIGQLYTFGVNLDPKWDPLIIVLDQSMNFAPATLLLVAVIRLQCLVKRLRHQSIFQKEKVILVHAILVSTYVMVALGNTVTYEIEVRASTPQRICKSFIASYWFIFAQNILNSAILVLFTYMTMQFSKPLDGQWQDFLLGYRNKSLDVHLSQRSLSARDKANKFHEEAVKDANRQIFLLSGLLKADENRTSTSLTSSQRTSRTEQTSSSLELNSEERNILEESILTSTSSILFNKVRLDAARAAQQSFHQDSQLILDTQSSINDASLIIPMD